MEKSELYCDSSGNTRQIKQNLFKSQHLFRGIPSPVTELRTDPNTFL